MAETITIMTEEETKDPPEMRSQERIEEDTKRKKSLPTPNATKSVDRDAPADKIDIPKMRTDRDDGKQIN